MIIIPRLSHTHIHIIHAIHTTHNPKGNWIESLNLSGGASGTITKGNNLYFIHSKDITYNNLPPLLFILLLLFLLLLLPIHLPSLNISIPERQTAAVVVVETYILRYLRLFPLSFLSPSPSLTFGNIFAVRFSFLHTKNSFPFIQYKIWPDKRESNFLVSAAHSPPPFDKILVRTLKPTNLPLAYRIPCSSRF